MAYMSRSSLMNIRAARFLHRTFAVGPREVGSRYRETYAPREVMGSQRYIMEPAELNARVYALQEARRRVYNMFSRIA